MQLLSFEVYVDQTTTESDEQRQLAQKHPWARLNVKSEPRAFGQGHSLNLALAALRASGATFWLKWEDASNPQRPLTLTLALALPLTLTLTLTLTRILALALTLPLPLAPTLAPQP
jgi:hypothetical protein